MKIASVQRLALFDFSDFLNFTCFSKQIFGLFFRFYKFCGGGYEEIWARFFFNHPH